MKGVGLKLIRFFKKYYLLLLINYNNLNIKKMILSKILIVLFITGALDRPIINSTRYNVSYVEEIIEFFEIDRDSRIALIYLPRKLMSNGNPIDGFVLSSVKKNYVIYLSKELGQKTAKKVIIHELAHIQQMQEGLLIQRELGDVYWKGEQVVDILAMLYHYDIEITLSNGDVKTYIVGTWDIIQDVTQPTT